MSNAAESLLAAWDDCAGRTHADVAVRLLGHLDGHDGADLAALPIGARDARLLALRRTLFGEAVEMRTACPNCTDDLELEATLDEFLVPAPVEPSTELTVGSYDVRFALPTSNDIGVAMREATDRARHDALWRRCVDCRIGGAVVDVDDVPAWVVSEVEAAMADADPQSVAAIDLTCPTCAHEWEADFDIVPVLWTELDGFVQRLLSDVSELALAYGWSETDVLELSPRRRQFYLERV